MSDNTPRKKDNPLFAAWRIRLIRALATPWRDITRSAVGFVTISTIAAVLYCYLESKTRVTVFSAQSFSEIANVKLPYEQVPSSVIPDSAVDVTIACSRNSGTAYIRSRVSKDELIHWLDERRWHDLSHSAPGIIVGLTPDAQISDVTLGPGLEGQFVLDVHAMHGAMAETRCDIRYEEQTELMYVKVSRVTLPESDRRYGMLQYWLGWEQS